MGRHLLEFVSQVITSETPIHGRPVHQSELNLPEPANQSMKKICPIICFYDLKYLPELRPDSSRTDNHECFFLLGLLSKICHIARDFEKQHSERRFPHGLSA
jgi:hypothetical protein